MRDQEVRAQLTVRGVPPEVDARLREEARRRGWSLNRTVVDLLEKATGVGGERTPAEHHDLDHFFGSWTDEEAREFDAILAEMRAIDPELWR